MISRAWLAAASLALLLCLPGAIPSPPVQGEALTRSSPEFDATYYHLSLDLRVYQPYLYGRTHILGNVSAGELDTLVLDFSSSMIVDSVNAGPLPLEFHHERDALKIVLDRAYAAGEQVVLDVTYQGMPRQSGFGTFSFGTHSNGDPYVWSLSQPYGAREWWPCADHPSDKADSVRVTATVPDIMRVGSNGLLRQETENGDGTRTFDWFSRYPISTYLVSIAAGVYDVVEQTYDRPDSLNMDPLSLPILHYAFRGSNMYEGTGFDDGWKHVIEILPVQEYWFGPYPFPEEKYGHAQFTFGGGMEHQTMSSMGNNGVGLIAHELAHQWFGDLITTETWPHLWLNEGFATYSELLTWKSREHLSPGTYDRVFDLYYGRGLRATGTLVVQDTSSVGNLFSGTRVYAKGGMILHMLRSITGDAVFRDILRSYTSYADVRYGTATTADFQRIAEVVSGLDLDTFFRQWVTEGTGHPVYDVWWRDLGGDQGYDVEVTIEQTQVVPASNVDVFEMPLTIQIETREGLEEFVVTNDERRQVFVFHVNGFPEDVRFDPERQILGMSSVSVVGASAEEHPEIVQSLNVYPNPVRSTFTVEAELSSSASVRLSLYDVIGRRVRVLMNETSRSFSNSFSTSDLPAGTYFLHFDTPQGRAVRRIILLGGNDR